MVTTYIIKLQVAQALSTRAFPKIPLIVLSSGKPDFAEMEEIPPSMQKLNQELLQTMREPHKDLARESSYGIHVIAYKSEHLIQLDEPELVVEAIHQVVDKVSNDII
jgi:hypothetical protein